MRGDYMKEKVMAYLNQDSILNVDMLEVLDHEHCDILYATNKGVLLFHPHSKVYMMNVRDAKIAHSLIDSLDEQYGIVIHQKESETYIQSHRKIEERIECYQMVYPHDIPCTLNHKYEIRQLDESYLEIVGTCYEQDPHSAYILEIIKSGWMYGIFVKDHFAGFIGRHHEGSIGLLHVLEEYRGMKLGHELLKFMVNFYLDNGWTPYSQVVVGNEVSMKLHRSLGFVASNETVVWLF